jgi:glycosyltransferase involved in cell wall biosynthesis
VEAAGLASAVTFLGWRSDTPDWYGACDIVALSSDSEGTPLAIIEAAAAGRPAAATAVGGVADIVIDGETGLLAPTTDEDAFAAALIRLADDVGLRERLGAAAPVAAARFGAMRLVDDLEAIYGSILAPRSAGRRSAGDAAPLPTRDEPREPGPLDGVDGDPQR